jgi:hypothetical protein
MSPYPALTLLGTVGSDESLPPAWNPENSVFFGTINEIFWPNRTKSSPVIANPSLFAENNRSFARHCVRVLFVSNNIPASIAIKKNSFGRALPAKVKIGLLVHSSSRPECAILP